MKTRARLILVIAPTPLECHRTARAFGLSFLKTDRMRFISNPYHLRGWSRGTPFVASGRNRWPEELDQVLHALTVKGQLRVANESDLADLRDDLRPAAMIQSSNLHRGTSA